jgi:hypothetical protein
MNFVGWALSQTHANLGSTEIVRVFCLIPQAALRVCKLSVALLQRGSGEIPSVQ